MALCRGAFSVLGVRRVGGDAGAGWRHEAEVMARVCDHRNIVQLHEVYEDANYVYILMEPCLGAHVTLAACADSQPSGDCLHSERIQLCLEWSPCSRHACAPWQSFVGDACSEQVTCVWCV